MQISDQVVSSAIHTHTARSRRMGTGRIKRSAYRRSTMSSMPRVYSSWGFPGFRCGISAEWVLGEIRCMGFSVNSGIAYSSFFLGIIGIVMRGFHGRVLHGCMGVDGFVCGLRLRVHLRPLCTSGGLFE
jgi:hypothetical protein